MSSGDRDMTLLRGDEMWEQLQIVLDQHVNEPIGSSTDWTGHDVYAHFGRWQQASLLTAREILAGRKPSSVEEDENTLNNRWRDEDRGLEADIVRDGCLRTRAELRDILMGLSAEQWNRWGQRVAADISGEHYEHHLADAGVRTS